RVTRYPFSDPKGVVANGGNGDTISGASVRFDEADRLRPHDRAEVASGWEARPGGQRCGRAETADAARRSAPHLLDRGHAVRLRRVHPPRDLARDLPRVDAE